MPKIPGVVGGHTSISNSAGTGNGAPHIGQALVGGEVCNKGGLHEDILYAGAVAGSSRQFNRERRKGGKTRKGTQASYIELTKKSRKGNQYMCSLKTRAPYERYGRLQRVYEQPTEGGLKRPGEIDHV